ncbi:MAG: hypothetical protein KME60_17145 [Cyanomargarita calcarea GSE-NOS-MK-12-04C]|jgi:hypothetical protein|uniref:Retroviral-like aspartic protease n=1 Tax=Cyanomargarita calcarea GSE-NOS-MK-12-04C TaxID=2839659 RepID=A0A951QQ56_9CYAN|nr:hypothetical protein [Cyanomargarita calcarea GSE-NOS-MK-12-04C]
MSNPARYSFISTDSSLGEASFKPFLPLTLNYREKSQEVIALLDTGAMVNVLPYQIGVQLGAVWEEQTTILQLSGNLAQFEARVLILSATIGQFPSVRLVFAWTQATQIPLLLGQANFFMEFDVCFYRSQKIFEVTPKKSP